MSWVQWVFNRLEEYGIPTPEYEGVTYEALLIKMSNNETQLNSLRRSLLEQAELRPLTWEEYLGFEVSRRNMYVATQLLINEMVSQGVDRSDLPEAVLLAPLPERIKERLIYLDDMISQVVTMVASRDEGDTGGSTAAAFGCCGGAFGGFGAIRRGDYQSPGLVRAETASQFGFALAPAVGTIATIVAVGVTAGVALYFLRDIVRPEVAGQQAITARQIVATETARDVATTYYGLIEACINAPDCNPESIAPPEEVFTPDLSTDTSPLFGIGGLSGFVTSLGLLAGVGGLVYLAAKYLTK